MAAWGCVRACVCVVLLCVCLGSNACARARGARMCLFACICFSFLFLVSSSFVFFCSYVSFLMLLNFTERGGIRSARAAGGRGSRRRHIALPRGAAHTSISSHQSISRHHITSGNNEYHPRCSHYYQINYHPHSNSDHRLCSHCVAADAVRLLRPRSDSPGPRKGEQRNRNETKQTN